MGNKLKPESLTVRQQFVRFSHNCASSCNNFSATFMLILSCSLGLFLPHTLTDWLTRLRSRVVDIFTRRRSYNSCFVFLAAEFSGD